MSGSLLLIFQTHLLNLYDLFNVTCDDSNKQVIPNLGIDWGHMLCLAIKLKII